MADIRTTPGGGMEAIGHGGSWQTVPKDAQQEIERLRRLVAAMQGHHFFCQYPEGVLRRWYPPAESN